MIICLLIHVDAKDLFSLGIVPGKHFTTPLGPIQLTAEECNEILMKRALQAAQGIGTPGTVNDTSQLNHALLNGGLKGLSDGITVVGSPDNQSNITQVQLIQTKQEPGTNSHSPKVSKTVAVDFALLSLCVMFTN